MRCPTWLPLSGVGVRVALRQVLLPSRHDDERGWGQVRLHQDLPAFVNQRRISAIAGVGFESDAEEGHLKVVDMPG